MDYLLAHPALAWAALALLAGLAEVGLPYFAFVFAAFGAVIAALVALRFGWAAQVISFSAASVGSLIFVRPLLKSRGGLPSRTEALVGRTGRVTVALDPVGRVHVGGEDWAARAEGAIAVDQTIQVTGWDGIVLLVKEV